METLANLESFARSAETGSFSAAARRLSLTPAAVSRNVAMLERNLGVRLFQRSTRRLTLTEDGERFLEAIRDNLEGLQAAISGIAGGQSAPAGLLKVSLSPTFGLRYVLPLLPSFLAAYPAIRPEWHFENRPVDLIAEGYDAAIGGGFELSPGIVSRALAPAHLIAVASPGYMIGHPMPRDPAELGEHQGIVMRSSRTGRLRTGTMRTSTGAEMPVALRPTVVVNDPAAMAEAALLGLGITVVAVPDALPHLETGRLLRILPDWYIDAGSVSIYYASRILLPAKTRVFVDHLAGAFRRGGLAERFSASVP
ncbi:LysR family transcriptional regulator [Rhizobium sp. TRM95111]|uniref:LysR family transcriptional regulator n=1 Tax=Rhizobium alarense TaxID=2846851 RepID=UPI001F3097A2|nr:LysR family transcriptional regulator [Rhizobium alarense]MCF3639699.1 LysR family transcriptional regulator [Rhizobium alarense]